MSGKKKISFQLLEKEFFPTKLFQFLRIYNPIRCFSLLLFPKLFPELPSHSVWPCLFPCWISGGAWRGKVGFEGDLWILAVFSEDVPASSTLEERPGSTAGSHFGDNSQPVNPENADVGILAER